MSNVYHRVFGVSSTPSQALETWNGCHSVGDAMMHHNLLV